MFGHRITEGMAVFRRVIKTFFGHPHVIAKVGMAGVFGDLLTELELLIKNRVESGAILQAPIRHQPPRGFARGPVGFFEKGRHLLQRARLAFEIDHHRAAGFAVILAQFGKLSLQGDVFGPKQFDVGLPGPCHHVTAFESGAVAMRTVEPFFLQFEIQRFVCGPDHLDDMEIGFFDGFVIGMAGVFDRRAAFVFVDRFEQFTQIGEPRIERCGRIDGAVE